MSADFEKTLGEWHEVHLIYGPRKGGTTLLQRLIDNSSVYSHPSETKLKLKMFSKLQKQIVIDSHLDEFSFEPYKKYFPLRYEHELGIDRHRYEKIVIDGLKKVKLHRDYVLLHLRASIEASTKLQSDKKHLFIKDVGGNTEYVFTSFLDGFPSGKIVSIRRDPKWTARAVLTDRTRRDIHLNVYEKIAQILAPISVDKLQKRYLHHQNILTIRFEELTADTWNNMQRVMAFFDAKFEEENVFPTIDGTRTVVLTSSKNTNTVFSNKNKRLSDGISKLDFLLIHLGPLFYHLRFILRRMKGVLWKVLGRQ